MERIFYKCVGYDTKKKFNKPIFFYHIPKCAGTIFAVLISYLFKKINRIRGSLFKDNDIGGLTAFDNYLKNLRLLCYY